MPLGLRGPREVSTSLAAKNRPRPKLDERGEYLRFPGLTVVCGIPDADQEILSDIPELIRSLPTLGRVTSPLPPSSYHVTLLDICCQFEDGLSDEAWASRLREPRWRRAANLLEQVTFAPRLRVKGVSLTPGIAVILEPYTCPEEGGGGAEENQELAGTTPSHPKDVTLNAELQSVLEMSIDVKKRHTWHLTLGYRLPSMEPDGDALEKDRLELEEKLRAMFPEPIPMDHAKLCIFEDMQAFTPWDGLSDNVRDQASALEGKMQATIRALNDLVQLGKKRSAGDETRLRQLRRDYNAAKDRYRDLTGDEYHMPAELRGGAAPKTKALKKSRKVAPTPPVESAAAPLVQPLSTPDNTPDTLDTPPGDRNFDDLVERFERQIYGTAKGKLRLDMVLADLCGVMPQLLDPTAPRLTVADVGGGIGQVSALLAKAGHRVVVCDISSAMVNKAREEFARVAPEAAPDQLLFLHCGVLDLPERLATQGPPWRYGVDLILFHAVVEWMVDPREGLVSLRRMLRPQGWLSVLFYNRHALVWRYLMNGTFDRAQNPCGPKDPSVKRKNPLLPQNPQFPDVLLRWLEDLGLQVQVWTGIRAVHDHMSDTVRAKVAYSDLLAAEQRWGRSAPYRDLARYVHMLSRRRPWWSLRRQSALVVLTCACVGVGLVSFSPKAARSRLAWISAVLCSARPVWNWGLRGRGS